MSTHVVIGAGAVGRGLARELAQMGHEVIVVTRSGSGGEGPNVTAVAADATDAERLASIAQGADAIYNCANPQYHRWTTDWPPISQATIAAAEATRARLVIMSNLYAYPKGASPMRATDPLDPPSVKGAVRAQMWHDALEAHRAGRIEAVEGAGQGQAGGWGRRVLGRHRGLDRRCARRARRRGRSRPRRHRPGTGRGPRGGPLRVPRGPCRAPRRSPP